MAYEEEVCAQNQGLLRQKGKGIDLSGHDLCECDTDTRST